MRTQFLYVGLLSMMAGGLVSVGCDDNHTGQLSDPSGPVKLVRITIQDDEPFGLRAQATDILDTAGSPLSTSVACDDLNPCLPEFVFAGNNPDFSCTKAGVCNDPLSPTSAGVPIPIPGAGAAGEVAGAQIRFVFDKLLNSSFETVTIDPTKVAGTNDKKYALAKGIVELDDPMGMPVPQGAAYWDPTGSPTTTSDPIRSPFGPAIVLKPGVTLAPNVTYTVKLTAAMISDRKGNPMADQMGNVVSGTYTKTFKTEDITPLAATSSVDVTMPGTKIANNDVIQVGFNTGIDQASVMCTVKMGTTVVPVLAYNDYGGDPTMCKAPKMGMPDVPQNDLVINIFPSMGTGLAAATPAAMWTPGDYTITCTGTDDSFGKGMFTLTGSFTVDTKAGDPMKDTFTIDQHIFPSQCTGM